MAKQSFKKWWKRLVSPMSEDFAWLRTRVIALGTTAMAILGLAQVGVEIPPLVSQICNYVVILSVGIAGTASFTVKQKIEEDGRDEETK